MNDMEISADFPFESNYVEVLGSNIHYIEEGQGNPILFLHGVPTSAYVWRNVIPHLKGLGRCIAPDLIGFGKSDKPHDINYDAYDHIQYIEKFIEKLNLKNLTIVMHGWGSIIGLHYAMRNESNCLGLAFYESYLLPYTEENVSLPYQEQILSWQNEDISEVILNGSEFIDKVVPQATMRELSDEEMNYYREPFATENSGQPIFQYLQDLPSGMNKSKISDIIDGYSQKLIHSTLPKLLMYTIPGFITSIATVIWAKENLSNLEIVEIGEEYHFAQESNPALMGETISIWLQGLEQRIY